MTMRSSSWQHRTAVAHDSAASWEIRRVIADHLGIAIEHVSDDAHLADDLGADWLDRLELMIAIEDRFGVEIKDDEADQICAVGDLIRHVESCGGMLTAAAPELRRGAAAATHKLWAPRRIRHAWKLSNMAVAGW
jgi:acyl carrier protein